MVSNHCQLELGSLGHSLLPPPLFSSGPTPELSRNNTRIIQKAWRTEFKHTQCSLLILTFIPLYVIGYTSRTQWAEITLVHKVILALKLYIT